MATATYTDELVAKINRAQRLANQHGSAYAVIEIDHYDGSAIRVCPESYLDDPEFYAFSGEVLELVEPETSGERVLRLWKSFSARHRAAFHSELGPERTAALAAAHDLLGRIRPLMVAHGHMHPDVLTY